MNDNHPAYPTREQLRHEAAANVLVARQEAGNAAFLAAVRTFVESVRACDWPLGCPVDEYDRDEIIALAEVNWTDLCAPDESLAMEIAGNL
jgi:hypothetical protein